MALLQSNVTHFFSRLNAGGAELRTIELVEHTNYSFDFVSLSGAKGTLDERVARQGSTVFHFAQGATNLWPVVRMLRARQCKVAHIHLGSASAFALVAARLAGVSKRIVHFRSDGVGGQRSLLKSIQIRVSRFLVRMLATDIVGVSPSALSSGWRGDWQNDSRCQVIANGIDAVQLRFDGQNFAPGRSRNDTQLRVCNIGRVEPAKNRGRAIQIWANLARREASSLQLVGELNPDDSALIEGSLVGIRSESSIVEIGDSDQVAGYLSTSDVLLVTSTREGLPGVVLEALACGTPVVSSDLPGSRWIAETIAGLTTISLDQPDAVWVEALLRAKSQNRQAIRESFDMSGFTIEAALKRVLALWEIPDASAAVPSKMREGST